MPPDHGGQRQWADMLLAVCREAWSAALLAVDQEPCVSILPSGPIDRGVAFIAIRPPDRFLRTEVRSSLLLLGATAAALAWANSPWVAGYEALWTTNLSFRVGENELAKDLRHWVNDGLMTLFFLVAGLEISREMKLYKRRDYAAAVMPAIAALGGMVLPALVYLAFNPGGPAARGWAIVTVTDLTLALGLLALVGQRCPPQLRNVVLLLVFTSNVAVVSLAAVMYPRPENVIALAVVLELFSVIAVVGRLRVLRTFAYLVAGMALWVAMSVSGLQPAVMGIALGVVLATFPPLPTGAALDAEIARLLEPGQALVSTRRSARGADRTAPPTERLMTVLHPWSSYLIVPLFAFANVGVTLDRDLLTRAAGSPITLGIVLALVSGKLFGTLGASLLAARSRPGAMPRLVTRQQLAGAAASAGIGFTMALFLADLVLVDRMAQDEAKVGILVASAIAATLGWLLFAGAHRSKGGLRRPGGVERAAGDATAEEGEPA
jgi:Na+:H+ antiporter, NhaA family